MDDDLLLPGGVLMGDLSPKPLDTNLITEDVTRGWYEPGEARHPYQGETRPIPAEVTYNTNDKYSWMKAPRYDGKSAEVGPLARNLVAYTRGQKDVKQLVDHVLDTLGVGTEALFSTLGRTAARGIETVVVGNAMESWIHELRSNIARGDKEIYQPWIMPDTTTDPEEKKLYQWLSAATMVFFPQKDSCNSYCLQNQRYPPEIRDHDLNAASGNLNTFPQPPARYSNFLYFLAKISILTI